MDPRAVARVVERIANPPKLDPALSSLSPQEGKILDLIAEGKTNKQIADAMFLLGEHGEELCDGLLRKLKVTSRTEAAIFATKVKGQGSSSSGDRWSADGATEVQTPPRQSRPRGARARSSDARSSSESTSTPYSTARLMSARSYATSAINAVSDHTPAPRS